MHPSSLYPDYNAPDYAELRDFDFWEALVCEPGGPTWVGGTGASSNEDDMAPLRPIRRNRPAPSL